MLDVILELHCNLKRISEFCEILDIVSYGGMNK